ncbi:cytochrome P450 [Phascolomyces articulosus]|uniref:Cytochrome P450 n=1 Tax=Phascolomyces articulosus TaxID=60185 RepID=A0AAD5PE75_9FUNG|nr:cytochrome P450 [Phascolomyces articulosus]
MRISIVVVTVSGIYFLYDTLLKPPRNIRHIPQIDLIRFWSGLIRNQTLDVIANKYTIPAASQSNAGIYTRFDFNGWTVRVNNPSLAKKILLRPDIFPKTNQVNRLEGTIIGRFLCPTQNIMFANGQQWKDQRKIANPAFSSTMPIELFGRLSKKLFNVIDRQLDEQPIDFYDLVKCWTLDSMGLAMFDFDFNSIDNQHSEWRKRYNTIVTEMTEPLPLIFPVLDKILPYRRRLNEELIQFLNMLQDIITQKRDQLNNSSPSSSQRQEEQSTYKKRQTNNNADLLTLMIEGASAVNGNKMSDKDLLSNLCVFFLAGSDTTAHALSCIIYYLAVNQEIQQKARQEVILILGDRPKDIVPSIGELHHLTYINLIINEALRISPPLVTVVARYASQDTELGGIFIPKGTCVTMDTYEMHKNPHIWRAPESFIPERFVPGGEADQLIKKQGFPWLAYGHGERGCIGMNFSLTEQRVLLSMLLRKYEWSLPEDSIHKEKLQTRGFILSSPGSMFLNMIRRF